MLNMCKSLKLGRKHKWVG